jgi:3-hydroxyisobutyrate dehydrogenase-like beta-hydroxyacid dehydrogenase
MPLLTRSSNMKIGFIGLGHMGRSMASRLIDGGHQLTVWNRTRAVAQAFAARGAAVAHAPVETLASDVVIRTQHLQAIAHGYGERDWAALGTYIMDSAAGRIQAKSGTA